MPDKPFPSLNDPLYAFEYLNAYYREYLEPPTHLPITPEALELLRETILEWEGVTLTNKWGESEVLTGTPPLKYGDSLGGAELVLIH